MPIPFLSSIGLNKNEVQDFKVFNLASDPTLTNGGDYGYFWLNTSGTKTLKFWDGANIRSLIDSTTISSSTAGSSNDLTGGLAGSLPYQQAAGDTTFLGIGTASQVLTVNGGATAPQWLSQSSLSVGSATNKTGGSVGDILVQSGSGVTGFLNVGTAGQVVTSNGVSPQYVDQSTLSVGSATTAGSVTNSLTAGTYLTSGGTYNGSVARTFAVDATDANTASKVVARDASGNFAAGTITATRVTGLSAPSAGSDAANRDYVDSVAQGLDVKASCKAATVSNINLASPGATIDTVSLSVDNRVLVKDQSLPAENGIYLWKGAAVAMVRSPDADTWDELVGAFTFVEEGTTANADSGWVCTVNAGGTLGTTAVTFVKFSQAGSYTAGNGIVQSGTSFNFAQSSAYTAGQIPFASSTTAMGFNANLHWDNSNNRLGIGTATPDSLLHLEYPSTCNWKLRNSGSGVHIASYAGSSLGTIGTISNNDFYLFTNNVERIRLASDGVCTWSNVGGVVSNAMVLNGTGLGVGVSPAEKLTVGGRGYFYTANPDIAGLRVQATTGTNAAAIQLQNSGGNYYIGADNSAGSRLAGVAYGLTLLTESAQPIVFGTNNAFRAIIDSSGKVGIGTTSPVELLDIAASANSSAVAGPKINLKKGTTNKGVIGIGGNYLGEATNTDDMVIRNDGGDILFGFSGVQKMRLTSSGNLGLGVTPSARLHTYISDGGTNNLVEIARLQRATTGTAAVGFGQYLRFDLERGDGANEVAGFIGTKWSNATAGVTKGDLIFGGSDNGAVTATMTLDANGKLLFSANGTASAPTIANADNPDTGLYWPTDADTLALAVGGSDAVYIDSSRRVGIGAPTPEYRLDIQDAGLATRVSVRNNNNSQYGAGLYLRTYNGASLVSNATLFTDNVGNFSIYTGTSTDAQRLTIKSTGQLNFTGLAADPTGAAGDVVYNSTSNRLKYHNGTAWVNTGTNKYSGALAGTGTSFTVTHNLGTRDVTVAVRKSGSTYDQVFTDVQMTDTNTVTIVFASSVTGSDYTVTVIG